MPNIVNKFITIGNSSETVVQIFQQTGLNEKKFKFKYKELIEKYLADAKFKLNTNELPDLIYQIINLGYELSDETIGPYKYNKNNYEIYNDTNINIF